MEPMSDSDSTSRPGRIVITEADLLPPPTEAPAMAPTTPLVAQAQPLVVQPTVQQPVAPAAQAPAPAPVYAPPAAPPPPIVPGMPATGGGRGRLPRWQIAVPSILLSILLAVGAFFLGQSTRASADEVEAGLSAQKTELTNQRRSDLRDQARDLRSQYRDSMEKQLAAVEKRARDAGIAQGVAQGIANGYSDGFTRGTCYTPLTLRNVC
jgi:cell division protein FtsB